jgi:trimeric autotransporter adhesin
MTPILRSLGICFVATGAVLAVTLPAAAQRVGISSAVNPATTGAPPGIPAKQLVIGENIVYNEHIATGPVGQTQILFVDESAMSVGPNSDMTIDKFVYDPKTGTGTEALSATRGIFRYVGGKLSKLTTPVTMRTPSASIGIRGGVFLLNLMANGHLYVVFLYGDGLTVTGLTGVTQTITRPGFAVSVSGPGAAPSPPGPAPRALLDRFLASLDGRPGGDGGSVNPPTDAIVANSGVSKAISGNITGNIQIAQQTQPRTQPPAQTTNPSPQPNTNTNLNTINGQTQVQNSTQPPPNQTGISGGFTLTSNVGNGTGFDAAPIPFSNASVQNGVFVATVGRDTVSVALGSGSGTVQRTGQSGALGTFNANVTISPDKTFVYADASPINHPNELGFIYGGIPVNQSVYSATGSPQFYAFQVNPDAALNNNIPFTRNQAGGSIPNPTVSPLYLAVSPTTGFAFGQYSGAGYPKALQASLAINGQGANQSSALTVAVGNIFSTTGNPGQATAMPLLNGIAEGSYSPAGSSATTRINSAFLTGIDGVGNSFYGNNSITGFVLDSNNCCNADGSQTSGTAQEINTQTGAVTNYNFVQPATATTLPAIGSGPQTARNLTGFAGGTMTLNQNGTATPYAVIGAIGIQTDPTNLQVAGTIATVDPFTPTQSGVNSMVLSYGSLSPGNTGARQGYINDNLFGMLESSGGTGSSLNSNSGTANLYLVTASAVPNTMLLPAGVSFCQCQFLQWGYWGGELDTSDQNGARADVAHINTWVAGSPTPAADINNLIGMSATASYSGAAVGSVFNNGAHYLAAGGFNQSYNFGTQTGTMTISNFDGKTFGGTVVGARGSPAFAAPLSGSGVSGSAAGTFFGPGAIEAGGSFAVQGTSNVPYVAAGTFAGRQP